MFPHKVSIFTNKSDGHFGDRFYPERVDRIRTTMSYLTEHLPSTMFSERNHRDATEARNLIRIVHGRKFLGKLLRLQEGGQRKCEDCRSTHEAERCPKCSSTKYWILCDDNETFVSTGTVDAVFDAVDCVKDAIDAIRSRSCLYAYLVIRPPGHHCHSSPEGYCIINNAVIAARYAQMCGFEKVIIIDYDYHHFNGTAKFLNKTLQGVSMHAYGSHVYPGTGHTRDNTHFMKNVPLKIDIGGVSQFDSEKFVSMFRSKVMPFVQKRNPDLIVVSNGLDAHREDPVGGLDVGNDAFVEIARILKTFDKPIIYVLEGGYNVDVVKTVSFEIVEELERSEELN